MTQRRRLAIIISISHIFVMCMHSVLQALQRNHLIEQERKLFVYFFTDPQQLTRAVADLARRLDAVVAAQHTK